MNRREPLNIGASVRDRLLNLSQSESRDFQAVLSDFVRERLLYRLQESAHARSIVLKGAALFRLWHGATHRPTRDSDFLMYGSASISAVERLVRDVATVQPDVDDGLVFDQASLRVEEIREANAYRGARARFKMVLDGARIPVQMDFGFGDVIVPAAVEAEYPTLLDMPAPVILVYPREAVVAEKFEAIVSLGQPNTRFKDFYDVWFLAYEHLFDGECLATAISATFERRQTPLPQELPAGLSEEYATSERSITQWDAFENRNLFGRLNRHRFVDIVALCRDFLMPVAHGCGHHGLFAGCWRPGGPWQVKEGGPGTRRSR